MHLICAECGCRSDEQALDWRAYLAGDADEGEPIEEALIFCPACATCEFEIAPS